MKQTLQYTLAGCLILLCVLAVACGSETKPAKTTKTVVFITNSATHFWKAAQKGVEKADQELADVNTVFDMTFGGTAKEQEKYINEALAKYDADAIAISPIDPEGMRTLLDKTAQRRLLITQDSDAPNTARALYVGADNRAAGNQAGMLLKQALPQGGKVMAFVGKRLQNAQERLAGIREALQGSKIEVIDLMLDDGAVTKAKENALAAMEQHPDLAGMVGLWSYNGPAALRALQSANKVGKIKIVCFDDEKDTLDAIKEGSIFGTVAQQPFEYGYQTVKLAAQILSGDKSVIPDNKTIYIPTVVIQRNNVDEYRARMEQLVAGQ